MPKFGELIEGKEVYKWRRVIFLAKIESGEVICTGVDNYTKVRNGKWANCSIYNEWREIPKPKRVHWEREDYPKVPRFYRYKKKGTDTLICTFQKDSIFVDSPSCFTYEQFAKEFDLLNEDGSLTELYKEVSE